MHLQFILILVVQKSLTDVGKYGDVMMYLQPSSATLQYCKTKSVKLGKKTGSDTEFCVLFNVVIQ